MYAGSFYGHSLLLEFAVIKLTRVNICRNIGEENLQFLHFIKKVKNKQKFYWENDLYVSILGLRVFVFLIHLATDQI